MSVGCGFICTLPCKHGVDGPAVVGGGAVQPHFEAIHDCLVVPNTSDWQVLGCQLVTTLIGMFSTMRMLHTAAEI